LACQFLSAIETSALTVATLWRLEEQYVVSEILSVEPSSVAVNPPAGTQRAITVATPFPGHDDLAGARDAASGSFVARQLSVWTSSSTGPDASAPVTQRNDGAVDVPPVKPRERVGGRRTQQVRQRVEAAAPLVVRHEHRVRLGR
jgi:hypothetical protein